MSFCWTVHLKVKKLYQNSKETLERSSHWCQWKINVVVNLATAFTWYSANVLELPFPLTFHERNQIEIEWTVRIVLGQNHMSCNSRVYGCTTFMMSLNLRRLDEMLIVNEPIKKFHILYISLKIFIFMQHKWNCAITALISAWEFPVFYNSQHINQLHSRLAVLPNTNSMFIYPQLFNLDMTDIV